MYGTPPSTGTSALAAAWIVVEVSKPLRSVTTLEMLVEVTVRTSVVGMVVGIAVGKDTLVDVTVRTSVLESVDGLKLKAGKRPGGGPVYATGTETEIEVDDASMYSLTEVDDVSTGTAVEAGACQTWMPAVQPAL